MKANLAKNIIDFIEAGEAVKGKKALEWEACLIWAASYLEKAAKKVKERLKNQYEPGVYNVRGFVIEVKERAGYRTLDKEKLEALVGAEALSECYKIGSPTKSISVKSIEGSA